MQKYREKSNDITPNYLSDPDHVIVGPVIYLTLSLKRSKMKEEKTRTAIAHDTFINFKQFSVKVLVKFISATITLHYMVIY